MENQTEHNDGSSEKLTRKQKRARKRAAKHPAGKHARPVGDGEQPAPVPAQTAPAQVQPDPEPPLKVSFDPREAFSYEAVAEEGGSAAKVPLLVFGIIVAVLLVAYLAGVFVFTGRFYPNTTAGTMNISWKTPDEVRTMMDEALADYTVQVRGQNVRLDLTAQDLALDMDSKGIARSMLLNMNPWAWPFEAFETHDETEALVATYGSSDLEDVVLPEIEKINASAVQPKNANIAYDPMRDSFDIVEETLGTVVDADMVIEDIAEGVMRFDPVVNIGDDVLVRPQILSDDERLIAAQQKANSLLKVNIPLMINGEEGTVLKGVTLAEWISVSPEAEVSINEEALSNSLNEFLKAHSTVGTQRSYTREDGKQVTVSGGSYGWSYDGAALIEKVKEAFANGSSEPIEVPVQQKADMVGTVGGRDWGPRYCDIDLSEQHAYFYDESGACVWETAVVTGSPGSHATPQGVYRVTGGKASPSLLIGQRDPATGKPEYETEVAYWMPFIGNSIGLHDATWQSSFGGSRYAEGYGSHGCVNISLDAAAELYGIIRVGDVVVVHW